MKKHNPTPLALSPGIRSLPFSTREIGGKGTPVSVRPALRLPESPVDSAKNTLPKQTDDLDIDFISGVCTMATNGSKQPTHDPAPDASRMGGDEEEVVRFSPEEEAVSISFPLSPLLALC